MLHLTSTTDLIRLITGAAGDLRAHASWVDLASSVVTPGRTNTAAITTATTTTVVGSPAVSTQRAVKALTLFNNHASVSVPVTVEHSDGANAEVLAKATLAPGESLIWGAEGRWTLYDNLGAPKTSSVPLLTKQLAGDMSNSTVTLAEVTGLTLALTPGTYKFRYDVIYQAAAATTGVRFSVNFTGTQTAFVANVKFGAGTTASSDAPDQDLVAAGAQIISAFSARAPSNAGWGTTLSVDTANANMYDEIDGILVVTATGNLQLFHGSEVAAASTVKAGSALIVTKL